MTPLAILICLGAAAAQGATDEDNRIMAEMGLSPPARSRPAGRPGIRQGGPECHWLLAGFLPSTPTYAPLQVTEGYDGADGGPGTASFGGYGSPLNSQDFAALVPLPGVSILPPSDVLVVVPETSTPGQPVSVPEPSSIALFAVGVVALALVRRARHG